MSQSFWEPGAAEQPQPQRRSTEPPAVAGTLALSSDDFSALEERILRTVELIKRERQARTAAEERAAKLEAQLGEQPALMDQLKAEVRTLRSERDQVRQRVERLLSQLDALEL